MSSSPQHTFRHRDSSPAGAPGRKRSQFTYRHLHQMATFNTSCPLRVIAHLDLDCFYAQVEMVRLGVPEDKPLAVQQWQGLIAINYPAREFGIGRHCTVTEAKKLCPELIHQHVATWREGLEKWAYHPDAAENIATDKVSLDPYRLESRRIMATIKGALPHKLQKVEKASIDEVFLDLSAQVHAALLERFPELANPPPYDDASEQLPMPSISALDWQADALVDLHDEDWEFDDPDWDDVALLVASEIVRDVRAAIKNQLRYTCSAGIARNKLLSKLGSGYKKPNMQTVIRNRAVQRFLSDFKFTKIRNLGGKLGEQVKQAFGTESVSDLLSVSVEQFKLKLGDDTGVWIWNTLRGIDASEVSSGTQIKSMLSAKSFRPSISTMEQAARWLRIFAADIFSRLVEEGVLENKRRPRTMNLHHRHERQTRSRSSPIPLGRPLDEKTLFELAKNLLSQIVAENDVWPCVNLSLSVGGFEEGISGNMGIDAFLLKGDEARAHRDESKTSLAQDSRREAYQPTAKRRRMENSGGIQRFLTKREPSGAGGDTSDVMPAGGLPEEDLSHHQTITTHEQTPITSHVCVRCNANVESPEALQSHTDWHFAKDLQEEERVSQTFANRQAAAAGSSRAGGQKPGAPAGPKRPGRPKKGAERGQSKLSFG
ncbi:N-acetyltransferase eso1 [Cladorrhinum samala]|uniref:DNA polymerase eta n=1 Tax=Cladorrhinum samala TaxID=585594 RepID=A0AAV9H8I6_9PEZI|nr:N-acetyltransferase eso1 [Cladorrhinum samala]